MKPRRTHSSNQVYRLAGGTEDNDLWVRRSQPEGEETILYSTWEPNTEERAAIAAGANIQLAVWGPEHPPVAVGTTDEPLGKAP